MPPAITNIAEASAAAALLPPSIAVNLSSGLKIKLRRLSWHSFEKLWPKLAALLLELWTNPAPEPGEAPAGAQTTSPEALDPGLLQTQRLLAVPALLGELLTQCTELSSEELGDLPLCDVLALSAAALRHNFIETAGLRDFFIALGELAA